MDPEKSDQIIKAVHDAQEVLTDVTKTVAQIKSAQDKVVEDLTSLTTKTTEFQSTTEGQLAEISKEQDEMTASVFDVVVNNPKVKAMWGYSDPLDRALYKGHVDYSYRHGCMIDDGKGYELDQEVYKLNDALYLIGMAKALQERAQSPDPRPYSQIVQELDTYKLFKFELERRPELRKALNTDTNSNWVPTGLSATLIDDIRLALRVAGLFPSLTMPAGYGTWELPVRGTRQTAYLVGESKADSSSKYPAGTPPTVSAAFTAVKHALRILFSDEMTEDSAVAILPLVRSELIQSLADARETSIINGDTDSTHFDSDVASANDVRKSYYGLRYFSGHSSGNAAVDIATLSISNYRAMRRAMGRFAANPKDTAYIMSISAFVQTLSLDEVETVDKFGSAATIKNGVLAMVDGSPIVMSEFMREDINASGVYDGITTTKTSVLLANTKAHWVAEKPGGVMLESARDIETGQTVSVASHRVAFQRVNTPGDDEASVAVGYNLTS